MTDRPTPGPSRKREGNSPTAPSLASAQAPGPSRKREGESAEPAPLPLAGGAAPETPLPLAGGAGGGRFKPRDTARARELRNAATPAERALWILLSGRKLDGFKFSRQMPVGPYFADFLCREAKLVVELDGLSHDGRQHYDARRDRFLRSYGYRVLRFSNEEVSGNLDGVAQAIAIALADTGPPPTPPARGRGAGKVRLPSPDAEGVGTVDLGISLEGSVG